MMRYRWMGWLLSLLLLVGSASSCAEAGASDESFGPSLDVYGGGQRGTVAEITASNYLGQLATTQRVIDYSVPRHRERLAAWEEAVTSRGAVYWQTLTAWNKWEQDMRTLGGVTIVLEMKRVQNGGAPGNLADFAYRQPPLLPAPGSF
jgi:hypothetical protein